MLKNDLTGKRFGRLTVIEHLGRKNHASFWRCKCDCGNEVNCYYGNLVRGTSTSCGCMRSTYAKISRNCHGESTGVLYKRWSGMRTRCYNPNAKEYENYGGRGIKVCEEWAQYWPFREWAYNNGYSDDLTLDRIDVNKDYSPENCRWIPIDEQASNKRTSMIIEYNGFRMTAAQWARELGIGKDTITYRVRAGWTPEECLFGKKKKVSKSNPRMEIPDRFKKKQLNIE